MKRLGLITLLFLLLATACSLVMHHETVETAATSTQSSTTSPTPAASQPAVPQTHPGGSPLVWHDEFNIDGPLTPRDWAFERGFVRNQELQWYQSDNATCKDGYLPLDARRETK